MSVQEEIVPALLAAFPEGVAELATPFDLPQVQVQPALIHQVAGWLKTQGFNMCLDVGGVDYLTMNRLPRFEVVYHLMQLPHDGNGVAKLRLRVPVPEEKPELPTVSDLYQSAASAECEVYDLFGITFANHPNLRRVLMPDDWEGYPLRRDYPVQGPRAQELNLLPAEVNRFHPYKASNDDGK